MEVKRFTCINVIPGNTEFDTAYILEDTASNSFKISYAKLYYLLQSKKLRVDNLELNGSSIELIQPNKVDILISKLKILGNEGRVVNVDNEVYYYYNIGDNLFVVIPDNIETLQISKELMAYTSECECKGVLTVIGGKGLISTEDMFAGSTIGSLDLSMFDTSNVVSMVGMFRYCKIKEIDISSLNTSNVTDMCLMFYCCSVDKIIFGDIDTSQVESMRSLFCGCEVKSLDLSNFDTSNVVDMTYMFQKTIIESLDLRSFNTSKVTTMSNMFCDCAAKSLDLSTLDTSNVTDMSEMFKSLRNVSVLDLSNFNTESVTNMYNMFHYTQFDKLILTSFNTKSVKKYNSMFRQCKVPKLNISSFTSTKDVFCVYTFTLSIINEIDLRNFDLSNISQLPSGWNKLFRSNQLKKLILNGKSAEFARENNLVDEDTTKIEIIQGI